jgi:hypothetical protein
MCQMIHLFLFLSESRKDMFKSCLFDKKSVHLRLTFTLN